MLSVDMLGSDESVGNRLAPEVQALSQLITADTAPHGIAPRCRKWVGAGKSENMTRICFLS